MGLFLPTGEKSHMRSKTSLGISMLREGTDVCATGGGADAIYIYIHIDEPYHFEKTKTIMTQKHIYIYVSIYI
jgi:hypothetical protein